MKRGTIIAVAACVAFVCAGGATIAFMNSRPVVIRVRLLVDDAAKAAVEEKIAEYDARRDKVQVILVPSEDKEPADLTLGPSAEGLVWRSRGWRLWARLETLAALEKRLGTGIIARLRKGDLSGDEFAAVVRAAGQAGMAAFLVPKEPADYGKAFEKWRSGSGAEIEGLAALSVRTARDAAETVSRGTALFVYAPDQFGSFMRKSVDAHPAAFPLPGSGDSGSGPEGSATDRFQVSASAKKRNAAAASALAAFLTTRGIARSFAEKLPGMFPGE